MIFNISDYVVTGSTLTFAGGAPSIVTNANAKIGSAINTGGLNVVKSGAGELLLTSSTTFAGGGSIDVQAGQLNLGGAKQ